MYFIFILFFIFLLFLVNFKLGWFFLLVSFFAVISSFYKNFLKCIDTKKTVWNFLYFIKYKVTHKISYVRRATKRNYKKYKVIYKIFIQNRLVAWKKEKNRIVGEIKFLFFYLKHMHLIVLNQMVKNPIVYSLVVNSFRIFLEFFLNTKGFSVFFMGKGLYLIENAGIEAQDFEAKPDSNILEILEPEIFKVVNPYEKAILAQNNKKEIDDSRVLLFEKGPPSDACEFTVFVSNFWDELRKNENEPVRKKCMKLFKHFKDTNLDFDALFICSYDEFESGITYTLLNAKNYIVTQNGWVVWIPNNAKYANSGDIITPYNRLLQFKSYSNLIYYKITEDSEQYKDLTTKGLLNIKTVFKDVKDPLYIKNLYHKNPRMFDRMDFFKDGDLTKREPEEVKFALDWATKHRTEIIQRRNQILIEGPINFVKRASKNIR